MMRAVSWPTYWLVLVFSLSPFNTLAAKNHNTDPDLFHFVTRPELKAPKWEVTVHQEDEVTPGYWFMATKPGLERTIGTGQSWFSPMIYDGNGELVWSGASQLDTPNVMDFRISQVGGESMMTMADRDRASALVLDNEYELRNMMFMDELDRNVNINGHECNFVDDGAAVLVVRNHKMMAPKEEREAVGYEGEECEGNYMSLNELNLTTGESIFDWNSYGRIRLNESSEVMGSIEQRCEGGWDFIHANSADKTPDGHYLFSGRHTDTIYKISKDDGSIMWRLGGYESDFDMGDVKFSRQHDIRCRGQNDTHTILSMLDNALGQDDAPATHDFSRGLLLALRTDTTPMTVSLIAHYDHPKGHHAQRRGNMHIMDNGNVFMGWSERALQTEHSPNGTLLMEARLKKDTLGSYRNYKFPFVGRPQTRPDVISNAYWLNEDLEDDLVTEVYVSWNGDTEVATWNLHGKIGDGSENLELINSSKRTGFETSFEYKGYLKSVSLEGVDKNGEVVGKSGTIKTSPHPSKPGVTKDFNEEGKELVLCDKKDKDDKVEPPHGIFDNPPIVFILGCACSAGVLLLGWAGMLPLVSHVARSRGFARSKESEYEKLAADDQDQELPLTAEEERALSPQESEQQKMYSDNG